MSVQTLDKWNGNTIWTYGIVKEIKNVNVTIDINEDGHQLSNRNQFVYCHKIFAVKMKDSQLVSESHMTDVSAMLVYIEVVSKLSIQTTLIIAVANAFQVQRQLIKWMIVIHSLLGPEFGNNYGWKATIVRSI